MEKLTLKEIAGYLPYSLKIRCGKISHPTMTANLTDDENIDIMYVLDEPAYKPILYPLEMLTKTIVHNGVEIIPIVEIGKLLGFHHLEPEELEDGEIEYGWNERGMEDSQPYSFGYFEKGNFGVWPDYIDRDEHPMYFQTNIEAIQLLHELHFDLYGLIERGLAIDKSTLNSKTN